MAAKPGAAQAGSTFDRLPPIAKLGVGMLLMALVGLLYFVLLYGDVDTQIAAAQQSEIQLRDEFKKAETSKVEYQKDLDEKTRREQLGRDQKKVLPDDPEMPSFLSSLQNVATVSGVSLTSWSPTDEAPEEFYAKVPMKLTLTGKFHQIGKFFNGVSQLDRIINVENIQIREPKIANDEVDVKIECLATAFRSLKPGETPSKKPVGPK